MEVVKSIVHRLEKKRNQKSTLKLRKDLLPISVPLTNLLSELRIVYNKKTGKSYGIFQPDDETYPFKKFLLQYIKNESDFASFSNKSMSLFKSKIDSANLATGGYVIFIHYKVNETNYLMVVMLSDKSGITINDETLDLLDTTHLDLEKLHLAGRIDVDQWRTDVSEKYLSFVKGRKSGDGVSLYFREFLGCTDYTDPKKQSLILLQVIEDYGMKNEMSYNDKVQFKQRIFDYCEEKRKAGLPIYLEDLSYYIDEENPEAFLEFSNSEKYALNSGFEPHRDTIKKFRRYMGKDASLSISFESDLLGNRINYKADQKILEIKKLPIDLQNELDNIYTR